MCPSPPFRNMDPNPQPRPHSGPLISRGLLYSFMFEHVLTPVQIARLGIFSWPLMGDVSRGVVGAGVKRHCTPMLRSSGAIAVPFAPNQIIYAPYWPLALASALALQAMAIMNAICEGAAPGPSSAPSPTPGAP
jgi:hypothetical protein